MRKNFVPQFQTVTVEINVKLNITGLHSSLFVMRLSLFFQIFTGNFTGSNFTDGRGKKETKLFPMTQKSTRNVFQ